MLAFFLQFFLEYFGNSRDYLRKRNWGNFFKKISNIFFGNCSSNTWKTILFKKLNFAFFKYSRKNPQKICYWFKSCPNLFCANNLWNFPGIRGKIVRKCNVGIFFTIFPRILGKFQRLFAQKKLGQLFQKNQ